MKHFVSIASAREFHDAHIAALDAACELPGGFERPFLTNLVRIAKDRMLREPRESQQHFIYRMIVREAEILLEGVPCEFDEAANELTLWLADDGSNTELAAYAAGRAAA